VIECIDFVSDGNRVVKNHTVFGKSSAKLLNYFRCWVDCNEYFDCFIAGNDVVRPRLTLGDETFEGGFIGCTKF